MRTTIRIDDEVFRAYKRRAADHGTTFAAEVEAALRAGLAEPSARDHEPEPFVFPVVHGEPPVGVDINSNAALREFLGD